MPRSPEWEGYPTIPMDFYQQVLKYRLYDFMMDDAFAKRVMEEFTRLNTTKDEGQKKKS